MLRALRVFSGVILLALLSYGIDWEAMPGYFSRLSWHGTLLAGGGLGSAFLISPWKWQAALKMHDLHFRFAYLTMANGIGFFLNNFLPSAIGGDAYRVMSTWPDAGSRSRAISAVLIERIVGFAALITIGNVGALMLMAHSPLARTFFVFTILGGLCVATILWIIYAGWNKRLASRLRFSAFGDALGSNLRYLRGAGRKWFALVAISILFQTVAIASIYALFQGLGTPVSWASCAMLGATAGLAAVVPISINGLGVVEGSFVVVAVSLRIEYEAALMVAVLIRLLVLPASLVFGLCYALNEAPLAERRLRAQHCDRSCADRHEIAIDR